LRNTVVVSVWRKHWFRPVLFNVYFIAIREAADKIICLYQSASCLKLFLRCIGIPPPSGDYWLWFQEKSMVLLKNNRNSISKTFKNIFPHVYSIDFNTSFCYVVKSENQLDHCRFSSWLMNFYRQSDDFSSYQNFSWAGSCPCRWRICKIYG